jgi:hypothetical protein
MPKKSFDYSKTIMYKIVCNDLSITDCYVGHTTDFIRRKYGHKSNCNCNCKIKQKYKIYQTIRANGGWDNWSMIEIEKYPCNDINEAIARERYWFETLNANLNSLVPNRTQKEYYEENKEKIKEYYEENKEKIKEYYEKNKEHIALKEKEYYEKNKEHIALKHKEYYEKNKEHIALKEKEYREKNKEKKKEYYEKNKEHIALKKKEWYEKRKLKEKQELIKPQT